VKTGRNQDQPAHVESRKAFYDWLAKDKIRIDGIEKVERDAAVDDEKYRSGGIRLFYPTKVPALAGVKESVLLEAGFDVVAPNTPKDISSWLYDYAATRVPIIDNRAKGVPCYDPRYTFVEKLQTISTKYRRQQESKEIPSDFMRHYYDVYSLLHRPDVQAFIGTEPYRAHKAKRFRQGDNQNIAENQAFLLDDPKTRKMYAEAFAGSTALYYGAKTHPRASPRQDRRMEGAVMIAALKSCPATNTSAHLRLRLTHTHFTNVLPVSRSRLRK
jgi:nucleotidyltransferase AbiEii toxin of type IV toxin-antitoxin system